MSVYTRIERGKLTEFLLNYCVGELIEFSGISSGIENTNYFVTTTEDRWVLTLFETVNADSLPYFLDLMAFLAEHGVPSAHPIADKEGHYLRTLKGKPAALVKRLPGSDVKYPSPKQVGALGTCLGHLHNMGQSFKGHRDNTRGPHWCKETAYKLLSRLSTEDRALLASEIDFQGLHHFTNLPRGVIHADLFRDNALFVGDTLTGIIDFYYACNGVLLYDLAVTVNDWCSEADGTLEPLKAEPLLSAYKAERPLEAGEREAWPILLRAAALRFWLSRLHDMHFPRRGEITHTKDPDVFKRILHHRRQENSLALMV